jgi:PAS domain S-box-containing protein
VNVDGHTTFVNRAAKEMLGWTAEDLLGKSIHDLIHHHHTDGSLYKAHDCPIYQSFRFEKTHRIEDEYFWRKDGKPIQVEYVSTPIYHQQVLAGAVVIFRDVTERKLNEKKLQEAFNEIRDLRDRLEQENAYLQKAITNERAHHDLIGSSPAIHQLQTKIELVSATEVPVLITGDTGTGKSIIANAIHKQSNRSRRTPIHFKCSSISKNNVEAELFGRLTLDGSKTPRAVSGALELAHGGTLILEEISDLPLELQSKLLVALMDRKFKRVGDTIARNLDIRVIAVSKKNIEREVTLGRFLDDLFLFLNVFPIHCIPLRERRTDIPELAGHMLHIACEKLNKTPPIITERTMKQLVEYDWPGNAKELRNVIERAAIVSMGGKLVVELGSAGSQMPQGLVTVRTEHEIQLEIRANIVSALRETRGKVAGKNGAAALLGIEPTTLYSRIKKFEITKNAWTQ